MSEPLVIDCATCVARRTAACRDCLVTYVCDHPPDEAVVLDLDELRAVRELQRVGLAPAVRHRTG